MDEPVLVERGVIPIGNIGLPRPDCLSRSVCARIYEFAMHRGNVDASRASNRACLELL